MKVLIKSAIIIDPKSDYNNQKQDILVDKGVIVKISGRISNPGGFPEVKFPNLHISQGWFDSSVCFGEPGFEERETIENGLKTAGLSGFTSVVINPNTNPVANTGSDIAFILSKTAKNPVTGLPAGALSMDSEGKSLAELFDMHSAGAVSFYDYQKDIDDANFLKIALQYSRSFGGIICSFPIDKTVARLGVMHEGAVSTALGLAGIPTLAEEIRIKRDLSILEYTGGSLHIPTISSGKSVELIREAKNRKLDVSCSVAIHNIVLTDEALKSFNTNSKVSPPLRTEDDRKALVAGLKDGTIDMVTSDHNPLDIELKKVEFDHASFGTVGLESAFGALQTVLPYKTAIRLLTRGRARFHNPGPSITVGDPLDVTLFDPDFSYGFTRADILSKSKNSIFLNSKLKGRVYGVMSNNKMLLKHNGL
ncbi:MAG: dihydroorotase [Flavobacteriaceae bacterium]|nr:dihydroorotase [Flavobacteriaceae bacterium]